jgi:hypothetical protein
VLVNQGIAKNQLPRPTEGDNKLIFRVGGDTEEEEGRTEEGEALLLLSPVFMLCWTGPSSSVFCGVGGDFFLEMTKQEGVCPMTGRNKATEDVSKITGALKKLNE